jgi:AcrR family transcriptional regulator
MVYYYFPTKDDLFLAVVEEVYERLLSDVSRALSPDVPVPERIQRLYERFGKLDDEELLVVRLVAREMLVSTTRREHIIARFERGHIPLLIRTVSDGLADGTLDLRHPPLLILGTLIAVGSFPQVLQKVLGSRAPFAAGAVTQEHGKAIASELVELFLRGAGRVR